MGSSLIALAAGTGFAVAADIPNYEPPPAAVYNPAPAFTWTGPYVGLQGGYGWGGGTIGTSGWIGGAYAGYNFQTGTNLVLGIEGDISATGKSGAERSQIHDGTIRARVGYAMDRFMISAPRRRLRQDHPAMAVRSGQSARLAGPLASALRRR
jgi:outer membrane immunogenic protein